MFRKCSVTWAVAPGAMVGYADWSTHALWKSGELGICGAGCGGGVGGCCVLGGCGVVGTVGWTAMRGNDPPPAQIAIPSALQRPEVWVPVNLTAVVIALSVAVGLFLGGTDFVFQELFRFLLGIQNGGGI